MCCTVERAWERVRVYCRLVKRTRFPCSSMLLSVSSRIVFLALCRRICYVTQSQSAFEKLSEALCLTLFIVG